MAKRKPSVTRRTKPAATTKQVRNDEVMPILHVRKGATLKEIYAKVREEFTAADLAKYAQDEEYIPAAEAIAYLEAVEREVSARKPRSKSKKV